MSLFNFNFCFCQYFIVYLSLKNHCLTLIKLGLLPNDTHVNCKFNGGESSNNRLADINVQRCIPSIVFNIIQCHLVHAEVIKMSNFTE